MHSLEPHTEHGSFLELVIQGLTVHFASPDKAGNSHLLHPGPAVTASGPEQIRYLLEKLGPLTPRELCLHIGCSASTLRRSALPLVQSGQILVNGSTKDRRYSLNAIPSNEN